MRLGGLGQLWTTSVKLASLMCLCQLLSPLVAILAILVSGSVSSDLPVTILASDLSTNSAQTTSTTITTTVSSELKGSTDSDDNIVTSPTTETPGCCQDHDNTIATCPSDHVSAPHTCQDPTVPCSSLPLRCLHCSCNYSCQYGADSLANCSTHPSVQCTGNRNFTRQYKCSYCFLTAEKLHRCSNRDIGCRSVGSPSSKSHWYIANCSMEENTLCLGKQVFSKRRECNWTEGYSWNTAMLLSITLGGFGADRFYLGHWQEGIGKLFSFGGLGVWTLVDVALVATRYIGPADGSLYV